MNSPAWDPWHTRGLGQKDVGEGEAGSVDWFADTREEMVGNLSLTHISKKNLDLFNGFALNSFCSNTDCFYDDLLGGGADFHFSHIMCYNMYVCQLQFAKFSRHQ